MNRFHRCTLQLSIALTILYTSGCATVGQSNARAHLAGVLWWLSPVDAARNVDAWQEDLDALDASGMDLLIFTGPYAGVEPAEGEADPFDALLGEFDRRGMRVYLSTLQAPQWWTLTDTTPELERARQRIESLERRYGAHPSFEGFYIPYECYCMWGPSAELPKQLYAGVSAACKEIAPEKKTLISPFFILDDRKLLGDFRWATPQEYEAFWTDILHASAIDTVALQDSGEHLACYTLEQRAPFFAAMKSACDATNTAFWANIETGELNVSSLEDYVARFGLRTHVNDPKTTPFWRGVPADKLIAKLAFARQYTRTAITWGYREFVRPSNGAMASELFVEYYEALR
ncbi:MAG: hypothetical protein AMXMBFR82_40660 [Candidatus Hydrogenedentota bacterium]